MNTQRRFGSLSSSTDPEKLSATVTGLIVSIASVLALLLSKVLGLPITAEQVATYAGSIGSAVGGIWFLFGLIRKGVVALAQKS